MPGPFDRLKPKMPAVHFGFQLVGVLPHARADQRVPPAQAGIGRDLTPNALIIGEQAFIRRIGKFHSCALNGLAQWFHRPWGRTVS